MEVTLEGIAIDFKDVQLWKALEPYGSINIVSTMMQDDDDNNNDNTNWSYTWRDYNIF